MPVVGRWYDGRTIHKLDATYDYRYLHQVLDTKVSTVSSLEPFNLDDLELRRPINQRQVAGLIPNSLWHSYLLQAASKARQGMTEI